MRIGARQHRTVWLIAVAALLLTAAGMRIGLFFQNNTDAGSGGGLAQAAAAERGDLSFDDFDASDLRVPREEIQRGGPPPDGIPALVTEAAAQAGTENPLRLPPTPLLPAEQADDLYGQSRVFVVTIEQQTRAYPLALLNWHEVVNDVLGGKPIAVVYCPLCDSASVVSRTLGRGEERTTTTFGVSGLLYNSNVILYDRATRRLWSQVKLQALSGPRAGETLEHVGRWSMMTAERFALDFPDATVLSVQTGSRRNYERNPYRRYFTNDKLMFPVAHRDDRLPLKARVIGLQHGDHAVAVPLSAIREREGGRMSVEVGDHTVRLRADDDSITVHASQPEVASVHTFWFAWVASHPETQLIGDDG